MRRRRRQCADEARAGRNGPGGTRLRAGGILVALLCATAALAACDGGSSRSTSTSTLSPSTTLPVGAPAEYAAHPSDWVLPGRDYDNSRATFDATITRADVDALHQAWTVELGGALSTVPLVVGDTVYVQEGSGVVVAVNRRNGVVRWRSKAYGFNIGPFGVAVADGRLFALAGATGVVALDAESGDELWVHQVTSTPSMGIDIQPVVFDGLVIVSTVPISLRGIYAPGDRGIVHALDAATGEQRWTFDTVKGDLWSHPEVNSGGGAWYPPAIDTARRLVLVGVANPAPFPGTAEYPNGSSRPGPNLYTDSAVALDLDTGALRWYHQVHPHDLFDRDLVHTLIAHPTPETSVVVATGKGGIVVGLDPTTGERLWSTPVGKHRNDDRSELAGPTSVLPGTYGGVLTPPATADGIVYVASVNAATTLSPAETAYFGSELGTDDGVVTAIEAEHGRVRWKTRVPGDPLGGAIVVNDLVLTALLDGRIVALDRASGRILRTIDTGGGINGWMSAAGDQLIVPVGTTSPPRLVAFSTRARS